MGPTQACPKRLQSIVRRVGVNAIPFDGLVDLNVRLTVVFRTVWTDVCSGRDERPDHLSATYDWMSFPLIPTNATIAKYLA